MYSAHCVNLCGGGHWICKSIEGQYGAENTILPQGQRLLHLLMVLLSLGILQQSVLNSSQLRKKGHSQYLGRGTGKTAEWD